MTNTPVSEKKAVALTCEWTKVSATAPFCYTDINDISFLWNM